MKRLDAWTCVAAAMAGVSTTWSADVAVGDESSILVDRGDRIVLQTVTAGETLPDVGADPIYAFDCTQTNGWVFPAGSRIPSEIPSLYGSRKLLNYLDGGDWPLNAAPKGATLVPGGLNGKPYLDFGAYDSAHGYLFSKADEGGKEINALNGIGTVIAVYGSQRGGGWLLGGGTGLSLNGTTSTGYLWSRGQDDAQEGTGYEYAVPMFAAHASPSLYHARVYHDGDVAMPRALGHSGGWEVLSVVCTNNDVQASGVGVNDLRRLSGGGMNIAELIVYGKVLADGERRAVEAYLQKKWFGRTVAGANGYAKVGRLTTFSTDADRAGVQATMSVKANETLEIVSLRGGRGVSASVTKEGAGTLVLDDASEYSGKIVLAGGTLRLPRRDLPAAELPNAESVYFRLDASQLSSFVLREEAADGEAYVRRWRNVASAGRKSAGKRLNACQTTEDYQPRLVRNALGPGLHAVDFGVQMAKGRCFFFDLDEDDTFRNNSLPIVGTILFVTNPTDGGGSFLTSANTAALSRGARAGLSSTCTVRTPLWPKGANPSFNTTISAGLDAFTAINGVPLDPGEEGYDNIGFQVVASKIPGAVNVGRLGSAQGGDGAKAGGFQLAELVVYDHVLTDSELEQASIYLQRKWKIGKNVPGYRPIVASPKHDIQTLEVTAATTLDIPDEGTSVRIRSLTCSAPLTKTGKGTLIVDATCNVVASGIRNNLRLDEGGFQYAPTPDVVADASAPATNTYFHVDATRASDFTYGADGRVRSWASCDDPFGVGLDTENMPSRETAAEKTLRSDGLAAVDFGAFGYSGNFLHFSRPLDSVRTVYVVAANLGLGAFFLGNQLRNAANRLDDQNLVEFARGAQVTEGGPYKLLNAAGDFDWLNHLGDLFVDGTKVTRDAVLDNAWHLVEIHATGNGYASAIGRNAIGHYRGGLILGEMICYDRPLTERERVATRNYLQKKWFGKTTFDPLPEKSEEAVDVFYETFDVQDGHTYAVDDTMDVGFIVGAGDVQKSGKGTLAVRDFTTFAGRLDVAEGTVRMTGALPPVEPKMPEAIPALHLDASRAETLTLEKDSSGDDRVTEWRSLTDNGWKAVPRATSVSSEKPKYLPDGDLGGRSTLRWGNYWPGMSFRDADNAAQYVMAPRAVLWILGSQEGGGVLLGSGDTVPPGKTQKDCFCRGTVGTGAGKPIFYEGAADGARTAELYVNDKRLSAHASFPPVTADTPMNTGLSGGWDFISMRIADWAKDTVWADGLAYRYNPMQYADGAQRLAEVAIYTNELTAAECQTAGYYLRLKWGLIPNMQRSQTNAAEIVVAAGACLDLGGTNQFLKAVGGSGTVCNGNLATERLIADPAAGPLTVEGAFAARDPFAVEVKNAGTLPDGEYEILSAAAIENAQALRKATLVGDGLPAEARLRVRGGKAFLRLGTQGLIITIR